MATKRVALGKGLGALIPEPEEKEPPKFFYCGIEEIRPNRSQPRKRFDEARLLELAETIREKGILDPLTVRRVEGGYELIAGERRWRAAQKAGLKEVPVIVREADDREVLELSLIENLQREDLNPIEEAEGFRELIETFGLSQEELSRRVGKDRTTITNALRLLKLPVDLQAHLIENRISAGHARALLSLEHADKQRELCRRILEKGLSVREAEALAKRWSEKPRIKKGVDAKREELLAQLQSLQDSLRRHLGTKVTIQARGKRGRIWIDYYSLEELERIVETILGR
ncbi:MAG: ParB/RepB/Spo0J family partition protein [Desulfobacterota bacterium]|nr:ParB/RepB/Spo0J family partition protein [Thermodesulfobacteriota bacterium]